MRFLIFVLFSILFTLLATPRVVNAVITPGVIANARQTQLCQNTQFQSGTYNPNTGELNLDISAPTAEDARMGNLIIRSANGNDFPDLTSTSIQSTSNGGAFRFMVPSSTFNQNFSPGNQTGSFQFNIEDLNMDIKFQPEANTNNQAASCPQAISQNAQIQVQPNSVPPPPPPAGTTSSCRDNNSCSRAGGIPCNPDNPIDSNGNVQGSGGIWTAIGCVPTEPRTLIAKLLTVSAAAGGGIALLLMIMGAFQIIASAGNPEAVKKGRDQFIAAALGLLFILFSVTILQIIGVDILDLPEFEIQ